MILAALPLLAAGSVASSEMVANAPPPVPSKTEQSVAPDNRKGRKTSRWFGRVGISRIHYNDGAAIALDGAVIPRASAEVTDNTTLTFDVGYDLSDRWAIMVMAGVPPRAAVIGEGSVAAFGKLGSVRFGPAILTAVYRLPEWHRLRPYVGAGGAHLFIIKTYDAAVTDLQAHDSWGVVAQTGVEYRLSEKWELYADYKHVWLRVRADGLLAGEPVKARVKLNPDVISAGIKFRFD
jgi:outer membrane protein